MNFKKFNQTEKVINMAVTKKDIKYGFMLVFIVSSILTLTVKINNDNFTFYSNRYIAAQDYWYVEYYKTYGTDEWVTLNRKPSLINTFINETESEYNIYRRTPYYGTASNKGTAGVLYSSWSFNKKPQSIEDFPTSYNTRFVPNLGLTTKPRTYRLIWKIDKIEKEGLESGYITDIDNTANITSIRSSGLVSLSYLSFIILGTLSYPNFETILVAVHSRLLQK